MCAVVQMLVYMTWQWTSSPDYWICYVTKFVGLVPFLAVGIPVLTSAAHVRMARLS